MLDRAKALLERHEGYRQFVYNDSLGIPTVGIGRNLKDRGITREEARHLLANDVALALSDLQRRFDWFGTLDEVRQVTMINMCFNLGISRLTRFEKMLTAMRLHQWEQAAVEALDSTWARQVGSRANELAEMLRTGAYPVGI